MKRGTENVASNDLSDADVKITRFGKILRATSIDEFRSFDEPYRSASAHSGGDKNQRPS